MDTKRSYRVGFGTDYVDEQAVEHGLHLVHIPCETAALSEMSAAAFDVYDAVIFFNPGFEPAVMTDFLASLRHGTMALAIVSLAADPVAADSSLLDFFRVRARVATCSSDLRITYGADYLVPAKALRHELLSFGREEVGVCFEFPRGEGNWRVTPLVHSHDGCHALQVKYGKGVVVLLDALLFADLGAEVLASLVRAGNAVKRAALPALMERLRVELPPLVRLLFQVYEEIPLEALRRRLKLDPYTFADLDNLLPLLEELILSGKISAKIRGEQLVSVL